MFSERTKLKNTNLYSQLYSLKVTLSTSEITVDPKESFETLMRYNQRFGESYDASEFYSFLMENIFFNNFSLSKFSDQDLQNHLEILNSINEREDIKNFFFQQELHAKCETSKKKHCFFSSGVILSLDIDECLNIKPFSQHNCFCCGKNLSYEKISVCSLPRFPVIVLHKYPEYFGVQNINLPQILNLNIDSQFKIFAVVKHIENHFISYVKKDEKWIEFNDEIVSHVSENIVFGFGVYMLFFQEVELQKNQEGKFIFVFTC